MRRNIVKKLVNYLWMLWAESGLGFYLGSGLCRIR